MHVRIVNWWECSRVNNLPVDVRIEVRTLLDGPLVRFALAFADDTPAGRYPVPLLWARDGVQRWVKNGRVIDPTWEGADWRPC
ncbi:MAG: hypothetical protein AAGI72_16350 [Pseudomonadota bacterium]